MKKALVAVAAAAAMFSAVALSGTAEAQGRAERQFFRALGVGAGVAAGALLFGAAARAALDPRYHAYAPVEGYYYVDGPRYAAAAPVGCPNGFWAYRVNNYGQPYGNPRWVCPPNGYHSQSYYYR
jgi:hypothetical protein